MQKILSGKLKQAHLGSKGDRYVLKIDEIDMPVNSFFPGMKVEVHGNVPLWKKKQLNKEEN